MPTRSVKLHDKIKESEIEEALVSNLGLLKTILGLSNDPKVIARQLHLRDESRLDLLLSSGNQLILIELKVTSFYPEHKEQILRYKQEIEEFQNNNQLPLGEIVLYLLVTGFLESHHNDCQISSVNLVKYEPEIVLNAYYHNLLKSTYFLRVKPKDYGVFSLGLINRTLAELQNGLTTEKDISQQTGLSHNSTINHLRTAIEFGLVRKRNQSYFLTDFGDKYAALSNQGRLQEQASDEQAALLKQYIAKAPFASSMVFGVYAIVESAFLLSRNYYPIEFKSLVESFVSISGKTLEWKQAKSKATATYTFLNFAIDLGLLGKIGDKVVITPSGFRFILMLQLHKSIEMIDSLQQKG